jgi:CPA2 family monovalent cation:H+ antiporter-2
VAAALGIPEAVPVIVLGSALSRTNPAAFERIVTPFKDVFLVVFFFFFGTTIDLFGEISVTLILVVSLLAIAAKAIGGLAIGQVLHRSTASGIEIGANTIAHGEFAIALAAIYGSELVSSTIAAMVIVSSIIGVFTARYSASLAAIIRPKA